jgi:MscS family membrane protein
MNFGELLEDPSLLSFFEFWLPHGPWVKAGCALVFFIFLRLIYNKCIYKWLRRLAKDSETNVDDLIVEGSKGPIQFILIIIGIYYFISFSPLNFLLVDFNRKAFWHSCIYLTCFWFFNNIIDLLYDTFSWILLLCGIDLRDGLRNFIIAAGRCLLVFIIIIAIAQEWQEDISGILAGLGLGGLAIAIAAQHTLANVYGGLSVILDKPFAKDHFIAVGNVEGRVVNINLRSTRIRTFDRLLVSVPNSVLSTSYITNYSKSNIRRIRFRLHLSFATDTEQVRALIESVTQYLQRLADTGKILQFGRSVTLDDFSNNSLEVLVVCYVALKFKLSEDKLEPHHHSHKDKPLMRLKATSKWLEEHPAAPAFIRKWVEEKCRQRECAAAGNQVMEHREVPNSAADNHLREQTFLNPEADRKFAENMSRLKEDKAFYRANHYEGDDYVVAYFEYLKLRDEINREILAIIKKEKIKLVGTNVEVIYRDEGNKADDLEN